jgi:hypothetical protein
MQFTKEHLTLAELGRVFGVDQKQVGQWLIAAGLRTAKGHPSPKAYRYDLISMADPGGWGWKHVWHADRTVEALVEMGRTPVLPPPKDLVKSLRLDGPFTVRAKADGFFEIVGGDDMVAVWVSGDWNARQVCRLLNTGHRLGVFKRPQPETPPAPEPAPTVTDGFVICGKGK